VTLSIRGGEKMKISKIDQKLIDIVMKYEYIMWDHKGLILLIICWIYLFWVGTFGCSSEIGIVFTFIALIIMFICIICPSIFV
jgi:hypothetical protein